MNGLRGLRSRALQVSLASGLAALASCYQVPSGAAPQANAAPQSAPGYRDAVARARASVVSVYAAGRIAQGSLGASVDALAISSGVVVDRSGLVVTNGRLFEGAEQLVVAVEDGSPCAATLLGFDAASGIALLQIDAPDLKPIELADIGSVAVGDIVLAIGNPPGVGQTVSQGIVGALGRKRNGIEGYIETDAAIPPGGYGGALVDTRGRLIGIPTVNLAIGDETPAIRLAIPVDRLQEIVARLRKRGRDA